MASPSYLSIWLGFRLFYFVLLFCVWDCLAFSFQFSFSWSTLRLHLEFTLPYNGVLTNRINDDDGGGDGGASIERFSNRRMSEWFKCVFDMIPNAHVVSCYLYMHQYNFSS